MTNSPAIDIKDPSTSTNPSAKLKRGLKWASFLHILFITVEVVFTLGSSIFNWYENAIVTNLLENVESSYFPVSMDLLELTWLNEKRNELITRYVSSNRFESAINGPNYSTELRGMFYTEFNTKRARFDRIYNRTMGTDAPYGGLKSNHLYASTLNISVPQLWQRIDQNVKIKGNLELLALQQRNWTYIASTTYQQAVFQSTQDLTDISRIYLEDIIEEVVDKSDWMRIAHTITLVILVMAVFLNFVKTMGIWYEIYVSSLIVLAQSYARRQRKNIKSSNVMARLKEVSFSKMSGGKLPAPSPVKEKPKLQETTEDQNTSNNSGVDASGDIAVPTPEPQPDTFSQATTRKINCGSAILMGIIMFLNISAALIEGLATYVSSQQVYNTCMHIANVELVLARESGFTLIYDAILTGSASQFVLSDGNPVWADRYNGNVDALTASIEVSSAFAQSPADLQIYSIIDDVNVILVDLETTTLNNYTAGYDSMFGPDYLLNKAIYNDLAADYKNRQNTRVLSILEGQVNAVRFILLLSVSLTMAAIILSLMVNFWKGTSPSNYVTLKKLDGGTKSTHSAQS